MLIRTNYIIGVSFMRSPGFWAAPHPLSLLRSILSTGNLEKGNSPEVGAGTGYQAALLTCLVGAQGRVVTVEIEPWLVERARERLAGQCLDQVRVVEGDGALGCPDESPFDRILLTTGTWEVFPAWFDQLIAGGRLVAPLQFSRDEEQGCIVVNLVCEGDRLVGRPVASRARPVWQYQDDPLLSRLLPPA